VNDEDRGRAYRDELGAALDRVAALERQLAQREAGDRAAQWLSSLEQERARLLAREPTRLTLAQRALPNLVTVPCAAFAVGAFLIGLWWLAAIVIGIAAAINWGVRALVRWRSESRARELLRFDERIAELTRLGGEEPAAANRHR
jgi:hypothetical protein